MGDLNIHVDETLQSVTESLSLEHNQDYEAIHLYVLAFDDNKRLFLSQQQQIPENPSLADTPNFEFTIGEQQTINSSLANAAQNIILMEDANARLDHVCAVFASQDRAAAATLRIIVASKIQTTSGIWLTEKDALRLDCRVLGAVGAQKLHDRIVDWERNLAHNRAVIVLVIASLVPRPRATPIRRLNRLQGLEEEPEWKPEEVRLPARKIGGRRYVHSRHIRRFDPSDATSKNEKMLLKAGWEEWKEVKKLGGTGRE